MDKGCGEIAPAAARRLDTTRAGDEEGVGVASRVVLTHARPYGSLDRGRWQCRLEGGKNWLSQEVVSTGLVKDYICGKMREKGFDSGQREVSRRIGRALGQEELRVSERSP